MEVMVNALRNIEPRHEEDDPSRPSYSFYLVTIAELEDIVDRDQDALKSALANQMLNQMLAERDWAPYLTDYRRGRLAGLRTNEEFDLWMQGTPPEWIRDWRESR